MNRRIKLLILVIVCCIGFLLAVRISCFFINAECVINEVVEETPKEIIHNPCEPNFMKESGWDFEKSSRTVSSDIQSLEQRLLWMVESRTKEFDEKDENWSNLTEKCLKMILNPEPVFGEKYGNSFRSQYSQDYYMFYNYFSGMGQEKGFYVDVGANSPTHLSNTWFYDVCLGWDGICIEGNPEYEELYKERGRSCKFINKCVWDEKKVMQFENRGVYGQVGGEEVHDGSTLSNIQCDTLNNILEENNVKKVHFLSMDIEGAEERVLRSFNPRRFEVDMIVLESNKVRKEVAFGLIDIGYWLVAVMNIDLIFIRGLYPHKYDVKHCTEREDLFGVE